MGNWWWEVGEKGTKEGKMGRGRIGVSGGIWKCGKLGKSVYHGVCSVIRKCFGGLSRTVFSWSEGNYSLCGAGI